MPSLKPTDWLASVVQILYPPLCLLCKCTLLRNEQIICLSCELHLPITDHFNYQNHLVNQTLWGRCKTNYCFSFLYFEAGNSTQQLIHQLKYKGNQPVGRFLGKLMGQKIQASKLPPFTVAFDAVMPVPLHPKKLKLRGFNQSECVAKGIVDVLQVPLITDGLIRTKHLSTQTTKSRFERAEHLTGTFKLNEEHIKPLRHVLLVDDVITTGATLASICRLFENTRCSITVGCLASTV